MQWDLKLEIAQKATQLRHELSSIASGLLSLRANLQQKQPATEKQTQLLENCLNRITKLIETVDKLNIG